MVASRARCRRRLRRARGERLVSQPQNYDYGMRDFDIADLDGNQLTFGTGTAASS
jgi:hypothetical protein